MQQGFHPFALHNQWQQAGPPAQGLGGRQVIGGRIGIQLVVCRGAAVGVGGQQAQATGLPQQRASGSATGGLGGIIGLLGLLSPPLPPCAFEEKMRSWVLTPETELLLRE